MKPKSKGQQTDTAPAEGWSLRLVRQVLDLPRLARLALAGVVALVVTLAVSPLVDNIYLRYFFTFETRGLPAMVTVVFGIIAYVLGWWLIIGMAGEQPRARKAVIWYLAAAAALLVWVLALTIYGYFSTRTG
jgi:hypothetical protein